MRAYVGGWVDVDDSNIDVAEAAVTTAQKAYLSYRNYSDQQRSAALIAIATEINNRREEIATLITDECKKPRRYALGEVDRAVATFSMAAQEALVSTVEKLSLDAAPNAKNSTAEVHYISSGIVLGITPFNFPINLVAHKIAPAIATGSPIIIKAAPATPKCALLLAEIIGASNLPLGAVSVIQLSNDATQKLVEDERIGMVSFTGSPSVGWMLKGLTKRKVALELGGNAAAIVTQSSNVQDAVKKCLIGGFAYSGQVCIHTQRIYVHASISESFIADFIKGAKSIAVGNPHELETELAECINESQATRIETWINESSGTILTGGKRRGSFVEATILLNPSPTDKVVKNEVFGPVVSVFVYSDFKEALRLINDSAFGLQSGIFTKDETEVELAFETLDVGGLIVNNTPTFRTDNMPYGGVKASGFGREGVKYAMAEMREPKVKVTFLD